MSALRWMAGRKATRGGIDHSSHRLVAIGFSERRTVLLLYTVALAAAIVGGMDGAVRRGGAARDGGARGRHRAGRDLSGLRADVPGRRLRRAATRAVQRACLRAMLIRSHAAEVLLDLVLITACYYAAYRLRFEGESLDIFLPSFTASLPVVLVCKLAAHYASGLYRRSWFTFGVGDVACRLSGRSSAGRTGAVLAATYLYRFERFSRGVFIIDAILLLLAIVGQPAVVQADGARGGHAEQPRAARADLRSGRARPAARARDAGEHRLGLEAGRLRRRHRALRAFDSRRAGLRHGRRPAAPCVQRLRVEELVFSGDPLDPIQRQTGACGSAPSWASRFESWSSRFASRAPTPPEPAPHDGGGPDRQLERRPAAAPVPGIARAAAAASRPRHRRRQRQQPTIRSQHAEQALRDVELIRLPTNVGFARANNIAAQAAQRFDALALLNPDAFAEPGWLEALVSAAEREPAAAAFASQMLLASDPEYLDGAGDSYHVSGRAWRNGHRARRASWPAADVEVFAACAAAALYRRAAFDEVDGFDEQYFCYFEDVDLGFRLRLRGLPLPLRACRGRPPRELGA